ncbi:MAG: hypothetical protein EAZ28_07990 [Oscillatoriales cyanobacterium]|nr:MAG: hypothetical protein EAZ28_07990 [Oscillatoriales cyanobacterium]
MPEKIIKVDEKQTSSAATNYGDADNSWLSKIKGTFDWVKIPQIDPGKIANDIKELVLKGLRGEILKDIAGFFTEHIKNMFGKGKDFLKKQISSIMTVKGKILGQLNTAEGQGLAIFGAISAAVIGGGVLLGAGPEVVTAMLRLYQIGYTLNLKETDQQIEDQLKGQMTSLYSMAGDAFGTGLASFLSGGVFRIPRIQINMTRVSILYRSLNEEARVQLISQVKNISRTAFFAGLRMMVKIFYRDTRKMLKQLAKKQPNHPLIKAIPGGAETFKKWGSGGQPWSMALYVQNKLEKLQESSDPFIKNIGVFLESAAESFGEGIQEFLPDLVRQPIA